jgi:hypothetical protein
MRAVLVAVLLLASSSLGTAQSNSCGFSAFGVNYDLSALTQKIFSYLVSARASGANNVGREGLVGPGRVSRSAPPHRHRPHAIATSCARSPIALLSHRSPTPPPT